MLRERARFEQVISDAVEAALCGVEVIDGYEVRVEAADTAAPRVRVLVHVPWWRRWWFDARELELRVHRMLNALATPLGRPLEYDVRVERA